MTDQKDSEQNTSNSENTGAIAEAVPADSMKRRRTPKKIVASPEDGPDGDQAGKDGEVPKAAGKPKARRGVARKVSGDSSDSSAEFADASPSLESEADTSFMMERKNEGRSGKIV